MEETTKKCPVCGVANPANAQSCSFCGRIFEDETSGNSSEDNSISDVPKSGGSKDSVPFALQDPKETIIKSQKLVSSKNDPALGEGSLYLTNRRLLFVSEAGADSRPSKNQLSRSSSSAARISIPLDSIDNALGKRGIVRPGLVVDWHDPGSPESPLRTEFIQRVRTARFGEIGVDINDWAESIVEAKNPELAEKRKESLSQNVDPTALKNQIIEDLADNQWRGIIQITSEIEGKYDLNLDPDAVEEICKSLVGEKLLEQDKYGMFFRKVSANTSSKKSHS